MEHKDQMLNYFQLTAAFALCKYLEGKTHTGFRSRHAPNPTAPGSTQEPAGSSSPPLSFPREQLLVAWQRYFRVYHNLCSGSE